MRCTLGLKSRFKQHSFPNISYLKSFLKFFITNQLAGSGEEKLTGHFVAASRSLLSNKQLSNWMQ
jgi:hypothetical protein